MWQLLRQCSVRIRSLRNYSTNPPSAEEAFRRKIHKKEQQQAKNAPEWEKREQTLRKRYGQWNPTHKLSRQQMNDIRELKQRAPHIKTVQISDFFNVSPESIRRILKSKWVPNEAELKDMEERAQKRKALSIERKRQEAEVQNATSRVVRKVSSGHRQSHQRQHNKRHQEKRKRMPYTQGIGDFIE